jgi:hypothetical protein
MEGKETYEEDKEKNRKSKKKQKMICRKKGQVDSFRVCYREHRLIVKK